MRNHLRFRPDPFDYSLLAGVHKGLDDDRPAWPESGKSISELASTLSVGGDACSTDLALDLVLHEIAEQVRLSTGAAGVAIALTRSGELVCRATTGSAPELGLRLDTYSGLSGLCLRTKSVQVCDDTEMDSRVDSVVCRNLRIRSILVAPVTAIKNGDVVGLLEAFSADPGHFRDRDAETLISFCTRIVRTIESADEAAAFFKSRTAPRKRETRVSAQRLASDIATPKSRLTDRWTILLTAAVVAAALFLGWIIGLADKRNVATRNRAALNSKTQQVSGDRRSQNQAAAAVAATIATPTPTTGPSHVSAADLTNSKRTQEENPSGGLVVYQDGRVIFREVPHSRVPSGKMKTKSPSAAIAPSAIISAGKTELLAPGDANQYVTYRVQPRYPELARKQHIQGPVLLKVLVGKDGSVQQVHVASGDKELARAASDAVVQWRFKPLLLMGQPAEFQTQITVDFKLP